MNIEHQYILEPGSKKHHCPNCDKKRFVRYIDSNTNGYLLERYGRCDREINCGYHLNPYLDGFDKPDNWQSLIVQVQRKEPAFIPVDVLKKTFHGYEKNVFLQNLLSSVPFPFETKDIETVISLYFLGTVCKGYMVGAITLPFIDVNGRIRTIQVKHFNESNNTTSTDFLHSIIEKFHTEKNDTIPNWLKEYRKNDRKVSCLFGEHLLKKHQDNPVALVEAPKTAIYGTLYFGFPDNPDNFLWLAVYNLSSLNIEKVRALKGRDVYLFPDLSEGGRAYKLWNNKAKELSALMNDTRFIVSDLLERYATNQQRAKGADLADFLVNMDWREFRGHLSVPTNPMLLATQEPEVKSVLAKKNDLKLYPKQLTSKKQEPPHTTGNENFNLVSTDDEALDIPIPGPGGKSSERFDPPPLSTTERKETDTWDVENLEKFFADAKLPDAPIKTCSGEIIDVRLYFHSHINIIRAQNGKRTYRPYYERLVELKKYLETTIN